MLDQGPSTIRTVELSSDRIYDIHHINARHTGRPVVIYFGLGTTALNNRGRGYLAEYSKRIPRPLINLELRDETHRTLAERATSDTQVLDMLDVDEFDIVGPSVGGLQASYAAMQAGERVRNLVTVSTIGTKSALEYALALPREFRDELAELQRLYDTPDERMREHLGSTDFYNVRKYRNILRTVRLARAASLLCAIDSLSDHTIWHDIMGSRDKMTDYRDHLGLVRTRNARTPHSSSLHLLAGEAHTWASKRAFLADIVATATQG